MIKDGDILKFKKPIHEWHKEKLQNGAKYIVEQVYEYNIYQTENGWWHAEETDKPKFLSVYLKGRNFCWDCGKLSEQKDYEVVGNVKGVKENEQIADVSE